MRTQTALAAAIQEAREHTDALFQLIRPDALYERTIAERHRVIFYLGHLEAFDWNLIGRYALDRRSFHAEFDRLFAFGIDPPPGQLPADQPADWPSLDEVARYNTRTRDEMDAVIDEVPEQLLNVALEHRLMHAETLAYILHWLPYDRKSGPAHDRWMDAPPAAPEMIRIPAGQAQLGQVDADGFGWDNEFQPHTEPVPEFAIAKYKITNGEYLAFVQAGGAKAPYFWVEHNGRYFYRGMFDEYPLPLDCPVYVTQEEAVAYARSRGLTLPTEAQYHRASVGRGHALPSANYGFKHWDPIPVTADEAHAETETESSTPAQLCGNGWEWTSTIFAPFPGFKPFPFYQNYSEPFFDGQHYILKGASPRTSAIFTRPSFRNWFRPSYPYVYATIRLVES